MITPKQASETLGVSASTLRRWASDFDAFLSPRTTVKRTYTPDDIAVLERVKDLFSKGMTTPQVKEALQLVDLRPVDKALITLPTVLQALELARNQLADYEYKLDTLTKRLDSLEAQLNWHNRPWYQKIGKRPPADKDLDLEV
ncbi:MAG TPA: MerR family transcriptional regulator [bacterium]|nr:MerR family transcriptional regulator [bacterium]